MTSMFDLYLKNNIMTTCEEFFNVFLEKEGVPEEGLTEEERELVSKQVDNLLAMIQDIYTSHEDDIDAYTEIADKLVGITVVTKMNEARLCRLLNDLQDKLKDD
jgi:hypothetical protein